MNKQKIFDKFYENGYLRKVKIFYSSGNYKYANLFKVKDYEFGKKIGTIKKYRRMNMLEEFLFIHCL